MNIAFRVDGDKSIGIGHIMRTILLANKLKKVDSVKNIIYITKYNQAAIKILKENNLEVTEIDKYLTYDEEIIKVKNIIKKEKINKLITDSYEIDQNYLVEMKKIVETLVSIHDFAPFSFPSDIVINGNVYAPELKYKSMTGNTKFLLGTRYLLLRDEFIGLPEQILNEEAKNILITVGGGDPLNLTPKIIKSISHIDGLDGSIRKNNLHYDIVIGPTFNNLGEIVDIIHKVNMNISLHFNTNQISSLMLNCDLAISAGGSTLYELAATGTPAVVLLQADNQIQIAEVMEQKGTIINLGMGDHIQIDNIAKNTIKLINDYVLRKKMSQKGQRLLDGEGANRCMKEILR